MNRRRTQVVLIDGQEVSCREISTDHDVDRPVGTGTLLMRGPRPKVAELGAPVTIHAGYDGAALPIFTGTIPDREGAFSLQGSEVRIVLEGPSKALWYENDEEVGFAGPMSFKEYWRSLCHFCGIPNYLADETTDPDGNPIMLGSNPDYNGGWIPIETNTSPGATIDRIGELFGYRSFDTPQGPVRLRKISGYPEGSYESAFRHFVQGHNVLSVERSETIKGMVNYWEVLGPTYTAPDGGEVVIRDSPATYTPDSRLGRRGVSHEKIQDDILVTTTLARAARQAHEIDRSTPYLRYGWTATGDPEMSPGQVATVRSSIVNGVRGGDVVDDLLGILAIPMWLMRVSHRITERGWTTPMQGWRGAGRAIESGVDCTYTTILGPAGRHFGNEYLAHYRRPNPDGLTVKISFPVADDYTTLTIRGWHHGSNSFVRNQQSEATRFEVWQFGARKASGDMSRSNENLERRYPYGEKVNGVYTNRYWDPLVVAMTGSLVADPTGANTELWIISGKDSDVGDNDDGEVRDLVAETCGVGQPVPLP